MYPRPNLVVNHTHQHTHRGAQDVGSIDKTNGWSSQVVKIIDKEEREGTIIVP